MLTGIEISGFRSIGEEPVVLNPLRKCNILVGKNNSGKSNVMRSLGEISSRIGQLSTARTLDSIDRHSDRLLEFKLFFKLPANANLSGMVGIEKFDFSFRIEDTGRLVIHDSNLFSLDLPKANQLLLAVNNEKFHTGVSQDRIRKHFLSLASKIFGAYFQEFIPTVVTIPEFREIKTGDEYRLHGTGLAEYLHSCQHPEFGEDNKLEVFAKTQDFFQQLLNLPHVELEITPSKDIVLRDDSRRLPFKSYGTGTHEILILLMAVLSLENTIVCIEEPEIHLHPSLQRTLLAFLVRETENIYFISTHSATLVNAQSAIEAEFSEKVQVCHIAINSHGTTSGKPVLTDSSCLLALQDLGVKASDILQANCVIWVEGPSDRIYITHWLSLLAPELIEGLHYSILFYGGRLLAHFSLERQGEQETNQKVPRELVEVLRVNQRAIVVMDSDRSEHGKHISGTKKRVRSECEKTDNLCWVTDSREIENYIPVRLITQVVKEKKKRAICLSLGKYDRLEDKLADAGVNDYASNKVDYARRFVEHFEEQHIGPELRKRLNRVVELIRGWNQ